MRTELEKLKYIEDYLIGKLPSDEVVNFENEIAENADLKKEVEFQKQIIKRSERMAFKEQLNTLHQSHFPQSSIKWWQQNIYLNSIIIAVVCIAAIAAFLMMGDSNELAEKQNLGQPEFEKVVQNQAADTIDKKEANYDFKCDTGVTQEEVVPIIPDNLAKAHGAPNIQSKVAIADFNNNDLPIEEEIEPLKMEDFLPPFDTIYYSSNDTMLYEYKRSGTQIHLPKNLIVGKENSSEKIPLLYREYRNQADIAFSGIPMIYKEKGTTYEFESGGMFEFIPIDESLKMTQKGSEELTIDFALTTDTLDLDFYELKKNEWVKKGVFAGTKDSIPEWWPPCDTGKVCDFEVKSWMKTEDGIFEGKRNDRDNFSFFRALFGRKLWGKSFEGGSVLNRLKNFVTQQQTFTSDSSITKVVGGNTPTLGDLFVQIEFEIKIPARARNTRFSNKLHWQEAQVYLEDPMKSIEVRKALYGKLMLTCKKCANKDKWASPEKLASLYSPIYNRDSLYKEVEKRRAANEQLKTTIIEANNILADGKAKNNYRTYKYKRKQGSRIAFVALKLTSFGVANCDAVRPIINYNKPTIIKTKFLTETGEPIKVERVSRVYLNRNSAFSYPNRKVEMWQPIDQVFLVFSKEGLYYVNTIAVDELFRSNPKTCVAKKLDKSVNTTRGLMKFLDEKRNKVIHN